ncbi:hypothetical protein [Candidatus Merdisoma sp. JLR.KK011]|uniref:hypothetical protein n=1 Tax=Candidatus Merdisoma sp. JLR.KK011 TaxID=3114299 RepID=UPI003FA52FB9
MISEKCAYYIPLCSNHDMEKLMMPIANMLMCVVMSFHVFRQIKLFDMRISILRLTSASIDCTLQAEEMEQMDEKARYFLRKDMGLNLKMCISLMRTWRYSTALM